MEVEILSPSVLNIWVGIYEYVGMETVDLTLHLPRIPENKTSVSGLEIAI